MHGQGLPGGGQLASGHSHCALGIGGDSAVLAAKRLGELTPLLDEAAAPADLAKATTAIFYSISNTQPGLRGVIIVPTREDRRYKSWQVDTLPAVAI